MMPKTTLPLLEPVAKTTAHFLGDGNLLTTKWSSERKTHALSKPSGFWDNITNERFTPNPDYCAYCQEFKEIDLNG